MTKFPILFLLFPFLAYTQPMDTSSYRDLTIPYIELNPTYYNFDYPICSDIFNSSEFSPPNDGVYTKATYGHRYLSSTTNKTDNHGGFDYWSTLVCDGVAYDNDNNIAIISMCDGVISDVISGLDADLEQTATGRSVQVTCDSLFQAFNSSIKINYRHLSALDSLTTIADTAAENTIRISKGDIVGYMGASGFTSNVHLHMSAQTTHPVLNSAYVHTARLFDPTLHPSVLGTLKDVKIELLHDWTDSALFRIIWPYNQTISRFEFINQSFNVVFDKEEAYDTGSAIRDEHDCIPGIKVFAYQFNGKQTAAARYQNEMANMPPIYPASPQRDADPSTYIYPHIPIIHDEVAYVYDFLIENIPPSHVAEDFVVKVSDVWGYTVEGKFEKALELEAKVLLEGPYDASLGLMSDDLRTAALIPTGEPFAVLGFESATGEECLEPLVLNTTGDKAVVDWIFIALSASNDPTMVLHARSGLLLRDGSVVDIDGLSPLKFEGASAGDYYITIHHRNHLGIITQNAVSLQEETVNSLDFTSTALNILGSNPRKNENGSYLLWSGDATGDGATNASDRSETWNNRNTTGYQLSDLNLDGNCNATDRSISWNNRNLMADLGN